MSLRASLLVLTCALALPDVAAAQAADPVVTGVVRHQKLKTVVLGLEGRRGVDEGLAEALTDIVQGVYSRQPDRVVLGRKDLERVLGFEETKQAVGCTDESCLSEIASALDADRLVSGSLDKIGSTYLFVLSELDARRLAPIGRTEHQLAVDEAGLVPAVRDATEAFLGRAGASPEMNLVEPGSPDESSAAESEAAAGATEVPFLHWLGAAGKLMGGTALGLVGAGLLGSGWFFVATDDNGDPRAAGDPAPGDDFVAAAIICWAPGGVVCLGAGIALAWGIVDLLFPPRVPVVDGTAARLHRPPVAPRTARREDVMAH